jgi:hypothetical protein
LRANRCTTRCCVSRQLVVNSRFEQRLEGQPDTKAPSLIAVAQGYSLEQFRRLMHDGVAIGDRELELMSPTARARFAYLIQYETDAMYAFLGNCARDPAGCWKD